MAHPRSPATRACVRAFVCALLVIATSVAMAEEARAADPPPRPRSKRIPGLATAATIDGSWVLALHMSSALSVRAWDAPYPFGTLGHYSARLLYGTTWTFMLGLEAIGVATAAGGDLSFIAEAGYRSDWLVPVDAPSCAYVGAGGGCGLGIGGFSFLQIRPRRTHWWIEAGGGWMQQRIDNDAFRTVAESSWVLSPFTALYELSTNRDAPVALRLFAGPGVFFGMRAGQMHPTTRGRALYYRNAPLTELYPISGGIGPGGRVEARLVFARHLSLEGELTFAPFLVGSASGVSSYVAPLHDDPDGTPVWRKATVGIGWDDPRELPFKATVAFFGAELSQRPVDRMGYRGAMLRFDIPLDLSATAGSGR